MGRRLLLVGGSDVAALENPGLDAPRVATEAAGLERDEAAVEAPVRKQPMQQLLPKAVQERTRRPRDAAEGARILGARGNAAPGGAAAAAHPSALPPAAAVAQQNTGEAAAEGPAAAAAVAAASPAPPRA